MKRLLGSALVFALTVGVLSQQVTAQEAGDAGTGADAVDPAADATGTPDTTGGDAGGGASGAGAGEDQSGFDPGWIGLAGLLGLAGLMGRDRDRRHDTTAAHGARH